MTKKQLATFAIASVATLGIAVVAPLSISAQSTGDDATNFIQQLAAKLRLPEDTVETAITEIREERQAERSAERSATIATALEAGDLTGRQVEILTTLEEVHEEMRDDMQSSRTERQELREEFADLTPEEREAKREEMKAERQQTIITALAEKGLTVSADELDELREAMQELDLGGHKGRRGPGFMNL